LKEQAKIDTTVTVEALTNSCPTKIELTASIKVAITKEDFGKLQGALGKIEDVKKAFEKVSTELDKIAEFKGLKVELIEVKDLELGNLVTSGASSQAAFVLLSSLLMVNLF